VDDSTAKARLTRFDTLAAEVRDALGFGVDAEGNPTVFDEAATVDALGKFRAAADNAEEVVEERTAHRRRYNQIMSLQPGDIVRVPLFTGQQVAGDNGPVPVTELVALEVEEVRWPNVIVGALMPGPMLHWSFPHSQVRLD